jgi:hypothetical protein
LPMGRDADVRASFYRALVCRSHRIAKNSGSNSVDPIGRSPTHIRARGGRRTDMRAWRGSETERRDSGSRLRLWAGSLSGSRLWSGAGQQLGEGESRRSWASELLWAGARREG